MALAEIGTVKPDPKRRSCAGLFEPPITFDSLILFHCLWHAPLFQPGSHQSLLLTLSEKMLFCLDPQRPTYLSLDHSNLVRSAVSNVFSSNSLGSR
eukprot:s858_g23.t1